MPSRRNYLTSAGSVALALAAGCSSGDQPEAPDDPQTTVTGTTGSTSTGEATTTESPTERVAVGESVDGVAVTAAEHRHSAFYVNVDAPAVAAFDGQGVFVTLDATGASDPPAAADISLLANATSYEARTYIGAAAAPSIFEGERAYSADRGAGWVLFEVPCPLDASDARVRVGDAAWTLPSGVQTALAEPAPSFELVEFSHPEAVTEGESTTVEATVEHTGGPGPARLVFSQWVGTPQSARVTEPIPVGESRTISRTFAAVTDPPDVEQVRLAVGGPAFSDHVEVPFRQS